MKKFDLPCINRRDFLRWSGGVVAAASTFPLLPGELAHADAMEKAGAGSGGRKTLLAACPYCGVGCGTLISIEDDRIVGIIPDKLHPTNKGVQCIKGLNAHEPIYRDRIEHVLVRKDMSDPITGHVSATKGRFDEDVFEKMPYDEAEELVAEKMAAITNEFGGNSIGLSGSGQLNMETQWIENLLLKGILGSNSIEANARMCMTSAVTGYFKSYGSDAPPTSYEDLEDADMITFWGHNAREAHPVLFWRVADHKKAADTGARKHQPEELTPFRDVERRHLLPERHRVRHPHEASRRGDAREVARREHDGLARVCRRRQGALLARTSDRTQQVARPPSSYGRRDRSRRRRLGRRVDQRT
jgi:anaerobic selenocysteine-containing dehydrogenase